MQNTKKRSLIGDSGSFLPREKKKKKSEYLCKALKSVTAYEVVQQYAVQGPELPLPFFFFLQNSQSALIMLNIEITFGATFGRSWCTSGIVSYRKM